MVMNDVTPSWPQQLQIQIKPQAGQQGPLQAAGGASIGCQKDAGFLAPTAIATSKPLFIFQIIERSTIPPGLFSPLCRKISAMAAPVERGTLSEDSTFATRYMSSPIPKLKMPEEGIPAKVVYQVIKDLRSLDSRPNLNLASFVTTFMEPEAEKLMMESLDVNFVDTEEYPSCQTIANRCVSMLAGLFHSPAVDEHGNGDAIGAPCVGSSEAIMLGGE